jgi:hypothetical protein
MSCPLNLLCCKEFVIQDELGRLQIVGANQCLQVTDFGLISVLCNQITNSHFLVELEIGPYTCYKLSNRGYGWSNSKTTINSKVHFKTLIIFKYLV